MRTRTLPAIELPRTVEGRTVFCPVQVSHVDISNCTRCGYMRDAVYDRDDQLLEFVCTPSRNALLGGMSI